MSALNRTVLVLGGTGQTGRCLVRQALDRGMGVHAVVRDARRLPIVSDRLTVVTGTPVDDAAVRAAMTGCHAVLSALGVSRTSAWPWAATTSPPDFMASSIATTVGVMKDLGLTRIVVVSAGGVGDSAGDMPPMFRWLVDHSRIGDAYRGHEARNASCASPAWTGRPCAHQCCPTSPVPGRSCSATAGGPGRDTRSAETPWQ